MKGGKYQILCVDDDQDILQTLKMILEKNGYEAVQASSADLEATARQISGYLATSSTLANPSRTISGVVSLMR